MSAPDWLLRTVGWRGRFVSALLGGLAVLGQAPFHLWIITLLSLALLLARLKWAAQYAPTRRAGFGAAFWWGLGYFLVGTSWIGSAFIARGPEFIPAMPPMILLLGSALAFFWGLAGAAFVWMHRYKGRNNSSHNGLSALSFISLFWLAEYTRGHIFGGFPWNLLGYIFEAGGPISQAASIFGIYGLTSLVLICAAGLEALRPQRGANGQRHFGVIGAALILITSCFGFGLLRLKQANIDYVDGVLLRIAHVRFEQKDKFDSQKSAQIVNNFLAQSLAPGIEDITHIIWPEGAVNGLAIENEALMQAMGYALLSYDDSPPVWLLNSLRHEQRISARDGAQIDDYYNTSAAVTFNARGEADIAAYNDKHRLVPFGEFIPGGKWMEERKFPVISTSLLSISPAETKTLAQFPGLPVLSAQICYEIIFSGLTTRINSTQRAQWILNQSNDAWYGDSIGPMQHANMSRYRAIEEGLPVVRAASNGVSGVISPYGGYLYKVQPKATAFIDSPLPMPIKVVAFNKTTGAFLVLINLLISLCCTLLLQRVREGGTALSIKR